MRLLELKLRDFRLYEKAVFTPCDGVTVLAGDNAQGKTAVLEAIALCCTGRSHRTLRDQELVRTRTDMAFVEAAVDRPDGSHSVRMQFFPQERRRVQVNGKVIAKSGELMGQMLGVLFSPEDLRMVKDGPLQRRRFVDMELSQLKPSYYYALQRYNRALTQRGNLLREGQQRDVSDMLDLFDEELAKSGAQIMAAREGFMQTLAGYAQEIYRDVAGRGEELLVRYKKSVPAEGDEEQLRQALLRALREGREGDLRRGITSRGPHRDDVELLLSDMDVRAFGSQGQQRTTALAMKLSELRVMHALCGEWPLLMLDDVMSELDPHRRRMLLTHLPGVQTIVTCTDHSDLAGAQIGQLVRVAGGTLTSEKTSPLQEEKSKVAQEIPDFLRD